MMKVKPFSYHIPPRRKHFTVPVNNSSNLLSSSINSVKHHNTSCTRRQVTSCNKNTSESSRHDASSSTTNSLSLSSSPLVESVGSCGKTVIILLFLGFIGVAGQGKLDGMDDDGGGGFATESRLSTNHYHFPHANFFQLPFSPSMDPLEDEGIDDDATLQQRISSMGQYGVKYKNNSYFQNDSVRHYPVYLYGSRYQQYKLERKPFGSGSYLPTPSYDSLLMSLPGKGEKESSQPSLAGEDTVPKNSSDEKQQQKGDVGEKPGNVKNGNEVKANSTVENLRRNEEVLKILLELNGLRHFSSKNRLLNDTAHLKKENSKDKGSQNQTKNGGEGSGEVDKDSDDINWLPPEFSSFPEKKENYGKSEDPDWNEDYEEDVLEKFIPGNRSHTSGRLRFRQSSQAELDGAAIDLTDNSLMTTSSESSSRRRPRRSVVHLYDMVVCSTGCNPLIFKGYGCYCGFLGSGLTVDGIDKCCAKHDWCYHHAKCPPLLTYFVPYYWTCNHGRPQCVTDFRGWKGICGAHLCECDRQFAECLKKFPCPRSRAMCMTSPFSNSNSPNHWHADSRTFPFTVSSGRPRFPQWRPPNIPEPPRIPMLPFPPLPHVPAGRFF